MRITIEPAPVKDMKPDDLFRDGGQNFRIAGFEKTTASRMCPNDEKFTRVIEVQE